MKTYLLSFFTVFVTFQGFAQMTVNNTAPRNSPFWLLENVLVDPNFVIFPPMDPITFLPIAQPNTTLVGTFNASGTGFPIDSGIVMCTNAIQEVLPGQSGAVANTGPHVDPELLSVLQQINSSNTTINDRVQMIFSFVATGDSVRFNYVFASHEYPQYTCSSFNDVFGFFLTGPGINGNLGVSTVNLATIPGTTVPVAINTINQGFPGSAGNAATCLSANPNYTAHSVFYNASTGTITSMGGYTQKFTAEAQVTCGNVYTIRLVLANVADHALSSAVYLEAQSFTSPSISITPTTNSSNSFSDTSLVEGCAPAYLKFRKNGNINIPMTINVAVAGTATAGVDYATFPTTFTIPGGQIEDSLMIEVFDDGIAEPFESIIITMQPVTTACYVYPPQQVTLWIRDKTPVTAYAATIATSSDTIYCPGDQVTIEASFAGGEGILTGWWGDDPTAPLIRILQPTATTTYYYYATDECQSDTAVDSVTIYLANYNPMEYNFEDILVCPGLPVTFALNVIEGRPPYLIRWQNGSNANTYTFIPTADSTWITFEIQDLCGVVIIDSMLARVAPAPIASFSFMNDLGVPLRVNFNNRSVNAASYAWDFGDGQTSTDVDPIIDFARPGTYSVRLTITSPNGCIAIYQTEVTVETDFYLYVPTAFTPDGDGLNECFEIKGVGFDSFEIKIFDRWGNQIFFSDNIADCWDGTVRNEPAQQGVYTFVIFLRLPFDKIHERRGMVTVYR